MHGWLKLFVATHGIGWIKREAEPVGQLSPATRMSQSASCCRHRLTSGARSSEWRHAGASPIASTRARACMAQLSTSASRFVLLQPGLGLCNRLRSLVSALLLARNTRRVLLLHWHPSDVCAAGFLDLFEPCEACSDSVPQSHAALNCLTQPNSILAL